MTHRSLLILIAASLALVVAGCDTSDPEPNGGPNDPPRPNNLIRGFGFSPEGFPEDYSRTEAFFDEVQSLGRGSVLSNSAWRDDRDGGSDAGDVPEVAELVGTLSRARGVEPVAVFGFRSGEDLFIRVPGNEVNDWTNVDAVAAFSVMAAAFAQEFDPDVLFLGNETDFYARQDPDGYADWTRAYRSIRAAVKQASPGTLVGTVFQVEHMLGRGLYSGWNTPQTQAWTVHDAETVDVVGLTVYPYLGLADPDDIPSSYLDEITDLVGDRPIVITETGWPANDGDTAVPWIPGEDQQVTFAQRLDAMIAGKNVVAAHWLFLYPATSGLPPSELATFGSVSVRDEQGEKRPVYDFWDVFNTD
ncbi:MAG: hypothetical protein HKN17_06105 [Rhodothermales bacterium]|nr:hypothetical protein [Rhodothermales bacterium]